jgi:hypothetical protein
MVSRLSAESGNSGKREVADKARVHLYAARGSLKYEKAALRWLERYLAEGSPKLEFFAQITRSPAKREASDG